MQSYETLYKNGDFEAIHRLNGGSGQIEVWRRYVDDMGADRAQWIATVETLEMAKKIINH